MSDCRFGVSPVNYPYPDPDPDLVLCQVVVQLLRSPVYDTVLLNAENQIKKFVINQLFISF